MKAISFSRSISMRMELVGLVNGYFRWKLIFLSTDNAADKVKKICEEFPSAKLTWFGDGEVGLIEAILTMSIEDSEMFCELVPSICYNYYRYFRKPSTDPNGDN